VISLGSILFIAIRYHFADGLRAGFLHLSTVAADPENQLKLLLAVMMALFSLLTLLFPFTRSEWQQLLAVPRAELPEPGAVGLSPAIVVAPEDPARIEHKQA
jgi:hypothetical protein